MHRQQLLQDVSEKKSSMKKVLIILIILFILLVGATLIFVMGKQTQVNIDGHTFTVSVAKTNAEKQKGLGGKTSLSESSGMLFPFDSADFEHFWMKDMKIPIDIVFIHDGHIVTIYKNVQPPKSPTDPLPIYSPTEPADQVLELAAGDADKFNFKTGDKVTVKNLSTK